MGPKLAIAGQVDCIVEYNGKLVVIDFKSDNKERQESWIDTIDYKLRFRSCEETFGKNIDQIVILWLAKMVCSKLCQRKRIIIMDTLMKL